MKNGPYNTSVLPMYPLPVLEQMTTKPRKFTSNVPIRIRLFLKKVYSLILYSICLQRGKLPLEI